MTDDSRPPPADRDYVRSKTMPNTRVGVELVPTTLDHVPHVMTWVNDPSVMQYFALRQEEIEEAEERKYLAGILASKNDRLYSAFAGDHYVGQCSINQIYWPARNGRIFLVVQKSMQGKGFAPAMLAALVARAFEELELHKLWLIVRRDNKQSQAMYLRAGFEFEGVLRDEYCVNGRYFDMVRMGIVKVVTIEKAPLVG